MKPKLAVYLVLACLALSGCQSETEFGRCVGVNEDRDPALRYKVSVRNAVLGIIFFELVAPPIFVLVDQTFCPVGFKAPPVHEGDAE